MRSSCEPSVRRLSDLFPDDAGSEALSVAISLSVSFWATASAKKMLLDVNNEVSAFRSDEEIGPGDVNAREERKRLTKQRPKLNPRMIGIVICDIADDSRHSQEKIEQKLIGGHHSLRSLW